MQISLAQEHTIMEIEYFSLAIIRHEIKSTGITESVVNNSLDS